MHNINIRCFFFRISAINRPSTWGFFFPPVNVPCRSTFIPPYEIRKAKRIDWSLVRRLGCRPIAPRKRMETTNGKHTKGKPTSENNRPFFPRRKGKERIVCQSIQFSGAFAVSPSFWLFWSLQMLYNDRMIEQGWGRWFVLDDDPGQFWRLRWAITGLFGECVDLQKNKNGLFPLQ